MPEQLTTKSQIRYPEGKQRFLDQPIDHLPAQVATAEHSGESARPGKPARAQAVFGKKQGRFSDLGSAVFSSGKKHVEVVKEAYNIIRKKTPSGPDISFLPA